MGRERTRCMVLGLAVLLVTACGDGNGPDPAAPPVPAPPIADCTPSRPAPIGTERVTMTHDGGTREYDLSVPAGYDGATAAPLIVDLHGFTASIEVETELTGMPTDAGARGYVVATPEALPTALPVGDGAELTFWNVTPVTDGGEAEVEGGLDAADDIGFIEAMVSSIDADLCIDAGRIHLTGMSNGAGMTMAVACTNPTRYAAVAPVAAVNLTTSCPSPGPISVVAFHGDADPLVGYDGGPVFGFPLGNPSVPERMSELAALGRCSAEPVRTEVADDVVLDRWNGCAEGVDVELYTSLGGGHDWPEVPVDTTETILDFFDSHAES